MVRLLQLMITKLIMNLELAATTMIRLATVSQGND